jgi:predicted RNase H-like HicB family nuclease
VSCDVFADEQRQLPDLSEAIGAYLEGLEELGGPLPKPRREHVTITA